MAKKFSDGDLQNIPACAAEYIRLVIKRMRYRRKVRADVLAELAAHFEDQLRDCKTDDEKEQKAQKIIEDFGDAKLLGVLLRRAKKRCRPLWRTVIVRTFQTTGVLILCLVAYTVWFLTGKPVITTNYVAELNRMVRPVADANLNAAPLYEKAIALFVDPNDYYSNLFRKDYNEVKPEEKQAIKQWIADNNAIFDLLIAAANKPYYWQTYSNDQNNAEMISILMPHLKEFKKLVHGLCWRARLQAGQGRYEDAFDDMQSCYRMGRHFRGDKTLIEQLVGISIEGLATKTLRSILSSHTIDPSILAKLQSDFEQIIAGEDFVTSLKTEKLFIYDEIQRCFTEGSLGGGHLYPQRVMDLGNNEHISLQMLICKAVLSPKAWPEVANALFLHPNKNQTRERAEQIYSFWEKISHKSPAQIRAENIDIEQQTTEFVKGNIFLQILTPVLNKVFTINYESKTDTQSLVAILALLRYRQDKSSYPSNLNELITAGYLKELPMDSFSDKPLVYRKTDVGFELYSLSENFTDDGGQVHRDNEGRVKKWAKQGDAVFWPVQK